MFSRYCVGWTVKHRESAPIAEALIAQAAEQQRITRGQLTVHADRGSSMTSKPVALLLADLGVTKTHSRPYTSTDNPYSEAQFKTLKYRPGFPQRFDSIEHARAHCREFFDWYNNHHRHSGIGLMTPATVHYGRANAVHAERASVLEAAYGHTPERFVRRAPTPPPVPAAAWINKPNSEEVTHQIRTRTVSFDLTGSVLIGAARSSLRSQKRRQAKPTGSRRELGVRPAGGRGAHQPGPTLLLRTEGVAQTASVVSSRGAKAL